MSARTVLVIKAYPPLPSPSGSLVKQLVDAFPVDRRIAVITWDRPHAESGPREIISLQDDRSVPGSGLFGRLTRRLTAGIRRERRRRQLKQALATMDLRRDDVVIGCTPEEIRMLARIDLGDASRRTLMLERVTRPDPRIAGFPAIGTAARTLARAAEVRALRESETIFALPAAARHLLSAHPGLTDRMVEIEHPMVRDLTGIDGGGGAVPRLVYAGGLDRINRNPTRVLELLSAARQRTPFVVDFYSYGNCEDLLRSPTAADWLHVKGRVSPHVAEAAIAEADIIITIGNKDDDLMPSKLFDCVSTGRPILHFAQSPADPYLEYLRRYPLSLSVNYGDPTERAVAEIAERVDNWRGSRLAWAEIEKAFADSLPETVAGLL